MKGSRRSTLAALVLAGGLMLHVTEARADSFDALIDLSILIPASGVFGFTVMVNTSGNPPTGGKEEAGTGRVTTFEGRDEIGPSLDRILFTLEVAGTASRPFGLARADLMGTSHEILVINNDQQQGQLPHSVNISGSYLPFLSTAVPEGGEAEAEYSFQIRASTGTGAGEPFPLEFPSQQISGNARFDPPRIDFSRNLTIPAGGTLTIVADEMVRGRVSVGSPLPEPATLLLVSTMAAGLGLFRWGQGRRDREP